MGSREGRGEGVDDVDAPVVLEQVEILGIDSIASQGSGGCENGGIPIGDLEALGDGCGGLEKLRCHGLH